jgi:hypothetical protein
MTGNYTWEHEYITQMGSQGFFGRFDRDAANFGAYSQNAWLGAEAQDIMVSGSDGSWQTMYMQMDMDLRINTAVRIRGRYWIGAWDNYLPPTNTLEPTAVAGTVTVPGVTTYPTTTAIRDRDVRPYLVHSEYLQYSSPGVQRSFSPGYWNTLWLTAHTPWGIVTLGKRPSVFGMGLAWNGDDNRVSETLSLFADYGPFRVGWGLYTSRQGYENYFNDYYDKNGLRRYDGGPAVTYRNGPLDMGIILNWVLRHRGAERLTNQGGAAGTATSGDRLARLASGSREREDFYGGVYMKYNNGRVFWNSEFDWYDRRETSVVRATAAPFAATTTKNYIQEYRVAAEAGCLTGPAKVSLLYAWLSGTDRRWGTTNNINQGVFTSPFSAADANGLPQSPRWQSSTLGNQGLFRPYTYLMVYNYVLGSYNNADTANGYVQDASCWGARVDYAVAANLNVYATFFKANRVGNGYGWGFLSPVPGVVDPAAADPFTPVANQVPALVRQSYKGGTGATAAPNIPDDDLGYEFGTGFEWKLLEGLKVTMNAAWWQPGNWFKFACVDKAVNPNWAAPDSTPTANYISFGINPDRAIDPILGVEMKVIGEF